MNPEKLTKLFFNVLKDLKHYLADLTLVGGWIPYIYTNHLWKKPVRNPVTTVDIDFGVDHTISKKHSKTIYETLSTLNYIERHLQMDRMIPVVMYNQEMPVEFITYPTAEIDRIKKLLGPQIHLNKIDKFDFLLKHRTSIKIEVRNKRYSLNCPKPSAFLYHKGVTFIDRETVEKQAKDLYYMYFILRYAPDLDLVLKEISKYRKSGYLKDVSGNIKKYFERISSRGCILVEQENGPDEFIADLRRDIFDRFSKLKEVL